MTKNTRKACRINFLKSNTPVYNSNHASYNELVNKCVCYRLAAHIIIIVVDWLNTNTESNGYETYDNSRKTRMSREKSLTWYNVIMINYNNLRWNAPYDLFKAINGLNRPIVIRPTFIIGHVFSILISR